MGSEPDVVTPAGKPRPNLDGVGIWWVCWACIWTTLLAGSMAFLIRHRHLPMLRIRGLGLSLTAIALLHLFWISGQLGYVVGALAPPQAEYWIMGTYFPFGIALFHASNARFLHVAKRQQRFTVQGRGAGLWGPHADGGGRPGGLLGRFWGLDYSARTLVLVGLCMMLQLLLTVFVYLSSRKFHPAFGLPGTHVDGTDAQRNAAMGRGWEWWPTCFWQLAWAWVVAPIVLWKSRNIKDVHGWRLQTIGCTLAN
ncbi:Regulator of G protein signaling superfamily [Cordyceps fumosorosea ARSEF 2679]|uniref:Regulator of G protein signaling superfamily n=1 Tax=Cordyceps fumosorosea (strain ARSEF 2679) TaxID=1081104 RepID=A0A167S9N8_CORFA|nr:Regulator of G protein signaling superfamily [Cordyceps fumosorosea ARSEF 2679]OAA59401.1 Regulator of G protein signaling superfamily [Cordyceps fumosorosea ARSEF 2679]